MPVFPGLGELDDSDTDLPKDLIPQLEQAVMMWVEHIDSTITACLAKVRHTKQHIIVQMFFIVNGDKVSDGRNTMAIIDFYEYRM